MKNEKDKNKMKNEKDKNKMKNEKDKNKNKTIEYMTKYSVSSFALFQ